MMRVSPAVPCALLAATLIVVTLAYEPGLHGPFIFDDGANILTNEAVHLESLSLSGLHEAMVSGAAGPVLRPLAMLSFALNHFWTGLDPYYFKATNLGIHLLNGVFVFLVCRRLVALFNFSRSNGSVDPSWVASAVAALWLAHPAQLTSVLYVVQRMTSLSGSFVLAGIWTYLKARQENLAGRQSPVALWVVVPGCAILATLCKENGLLLIPLLFVVEATLLRFAVARAPRMGTLEHFYYVFLVMPTMALAVLLFRNPSWVFSAELGRGFTVLERLLTESRVLLLYLKILILPAIDDLALYYDDYAISRGIFDPVTTLWSVLALAGAILSATVLRNRFPWFSFSVLWFLAAHAMESSFIMLELVHIHRNYLAFIGPLLGGCIAFSRTLHEARKGLATGIVTVLFLSCVTVTWQRAAQWSNPIDLIGYEVRHRPYSPRAHYDLARLYVIVESNLNERRYRELAERHFRRSAELNPRGFSALVALVQIGSRSGAQVDESAVDALCVRLKRYPVVAGDLNAFRQLVNCNADRKCELPPERMLDIFASALGNPRLTRNQKAAILMTMAPYYSDRLGDLPVALNMIDEAVDLAPDNAGFRLVLAGAHALNRDRKRAVEQLRIVESMNRMGRYNREIRAVRQRLEKLDDRRTE